MIVLKNIVVTGSNKGIGYGIVDNLAGKGGWNIIMAVRNKELGQATRNSILAKYPQANLHLQRLDLEDNKTIDDFVALVKQKYGYIHILVNNAGVAAKGDPCSAQIARYTFQTNFYGTIDLTEKLLPLITDNGKIITLGSTSGVNAFKKMTSQTFRKRYNKQNLSRSELFQLMDEFVDSADKEPYPLEGCPRSCYGISKLGINLYHSVIIHNEDVIKRNIQVYVCCPGYVKTDMTSNKGTMSLQQGIRTPIYLIELPFQVNKDFQGRFFYLQKPKSYFQ